MWCFIKSWCTVHSFYNRKQVNNISIVVLNLPGKPELLPSSLKGSGYSGDGDDIISVIAPPPPNGFFEVPEVSTSHPEDVGPLKPSLWATSLLRMAPCCDSNPCPIFIVKPGNNCNNELFWAGGRGLQREPQSRPLPKLSEWLHPHQVLFRTDKITVNDNSHDWRYRWSCNQTIELPFLTEATPGNLYFQPDIMLESPGAPIKISRFAFSTHLVLIPGLQDNLGGLETQRTCKLWKGDG